MKMQLLLGATLLVGSSLAEARRVRPKPVDFRPPLGLTFMEDEPLSARALDPLLEDPAFVESLPELSDSEVVRVLQSHFNEVRTCHRLEAEKGLASGGRATLWLEIEADGVVKSSLVNAPSLERTRVPACVRNASLHWTFPPSAGPKLFAAPIVFVEGS